MVCRSQGRDPSAARRRRARRTGWRRARPGRPGWAWTRRWWWWWWWCCCCCCREPRSTRRPPCGCVFGRRRQRRLRRQPPPVQDNEAVKSRETSGPRGKGALIYFQASAGRWGLERRFWSLVVALYCNPSARCAACGLVLRLPSGSYQSRSCQWPAPQELPGVALASKEQEPPCSLALDKVLLVHRPISGRESSLQPHGAPLRLSRPR